jgi:hypothetical protein
MSRKIILAAILLTALMTTGTPAQNAKAGTDHTKWVESVLRAADTIKPGMTRKELLRVFTEEGGLSSRTWRTYVYKDCPYIKVDVEFSPAGDVGNGLREGPNDKIVKISKPYLEYSIMD